MKQEQTEIEVRSFNSTLGRVIFIMDGFGYEFQGHDEQTLQNSRDQNMVVKIIGFETGSQQVTLSVNGIIYKMYRNRRKLI